MLSADSSHIVGAARLLAELSGLAEDTIRTCARKLGQLELPAEVLREQPPPAAAQPRKPKRKKAAAGASGGGAKRQRLGGGATAGGEQQQQPAAMAVIGSQADGILDLVDVGGALDLFMGARH